jgi:F-type H+-transporting ATPase subunit a
VAPAGVPPALYVMVVPIEILSTFILRPVTLALRLTMNMLAGHLLLVLCFSATQFFVFYARWPVWLVRGRNFHIWIRLYSF